MIVYALYQCGGYDLYGLYSTREKAEEAAKSMTRIPNSYQIIPMEVK